MHQAHTQSETKGKCCAKDGDHHKQRRGKCGSSHKHEANAKAAPNPLNILQERFARGEIDTTEYEEKRRLLTRA